METKDLFSGHSHIYAAFRPAYPAELYTFILQFVKNKNMAWDCGTGNGQVARSLSLYFNQVHATDISQKQLDHAFRIQNVIYSLGSASQTSFADDTFDLITVGQALHWLDRPSFYAEAKRVGKTEAVIAAWGYSLLSINPPIDDQLNYFYKNVVGPYWDAARTLVDQQYKTVDFPFAEIDVPLFEMRFSWTLQHLAGYLESWSATQHYIKQKDTNPVPYLLKTLTAYWKPDETKMVSFPVFTRLGVIQK